MQKSKPYLNTIRSKHPTIAYDVSAYASGSKNSSDIVYTEYIQSIETIDLAIRTISNIISLCDMKLYRLDNKGVKKPHSIKNLDLEFPNETDSSVDFLRKLAVNVYSQGAGLIVTEEGKRGKASGKMINLYVLNVASIEAVSDGKKLISQFKYKAENGTDVYYKAEDCIYINDSIDPSNLLYSLSRLRALNDVIQMQAGIVKQSKELLTGGAKTASIISSDSPISERNMKTIQTEFNKFMTSATSSSMFLNAPLNVSQVGNTMSGTDMLQLLTHVNKMMLQAFAIPDTLLGIGTTGGANRNTGITYVNRIFFTMQLKPVLKNIEKQFTRFLREQMGISNVVMEFSYNDLDILKLADEEKSAMVLAQLKGGLISLNEAREMTEYLPIDSEAANNIYMPAFLLGTAPVSYNNFEESLATMLAASGSVAKSSALPSGNAGGADNTNVITDSRGGPADAVPV